MKIYIDKDFKCYTAYAEGLTACDVSFFDGKCDSFIEGYRFIPSGKSWTRSDGLVFRGEMVSPWNDFRELDAAQREYEQQILNEYKESLLELGVEV